MKGNKHLQNLISGPVRVLADPVARKIAAGEVVDRPYGAVRELLDNAIDSGADEIALDLDGGGIDAIRVTDNGCGMTREDLEVCWMSHATSKIESVDDLDRVITLGFRGEALSSMAACSRMEIISTREDHTFRLVIHGGRIIELISHMGAPGTSVMVKDLFYNMPARRRFLKSKRGEISLCRRIFLEKVAAHPEITFRLFFDGVLKSYFPQDSCMNRVQACWPRVATPHAWWETKAEGDGFSITAVHARPEISRKDRMYIQIFANRRRIDEFPLVQAVQYAYDPWMPGGAFPLAFIFIEMDPSLVDFNIHPAKKEVRFHHFPALRHRLIETLQDRLSGEAYQRRVESGEDSLHQKTFSDASTVQSTQPFYSVVASPSPRDFSSKHHPTAREAESFGNMITGKKLDRFPIKPVGKQQDFTYLGQTMGVFLLAEHADSLFIIDQHAAHEKILFEQFRNGEKNPEMLLIPRVLKPHKHAGMKLELRKERLAMSGIQIAQNDNGDWTLIAVPGVASNQEESIVSFLEEGAGDAEGLEKALWADLACKAAVKDHSLLDEAMAVRLIREVFALENPRCPHGRPLWFEVSRRELFELVGRSI